MKSKVYFTKIITPESVLNLYKHLEKEENVKLIMLVKDAEEGIESYIREISLGRNFYNNLVVIDLNSEDETVKILEELKNENINMKILNKEEGIDYILDQTKKASV